jgi:protein-tyrosine phosphatase
MAGQPFWINHQLAIVPRPHGDVWLDAEMAALREAGIDVIVSMLEEAEATELRLDREEAAANAAGLLFLNFPIPDRRVPSNVKRFNEFMSLLERLLAAGKRIGIHCRACIGRSSLVAASLLVRSGISTTEAWHRVEIARGLSVPDTKEQREWVDSHAGPKT